MSANVNGTFSTQASVASAKTVKTSVVFNQAPEIQEIPPNQTKKTDRQSIAQSLSAAIRASTGEDNNYSFDEQDRSFELADIKSGIPSRVAAERFPCLAGIISSHRFETAIGALIITNCFTMGLEAEQQLGKAMDFKKTVEISEHILTACFLLEFLLRLLVFGPLYFCPGVKTFFNFVDMLLVLVTGVMVTWILPLIQTNENSSDGGIMRTLTVLRAFRLVRLVRVVRKVELFHEVYVLLRGLTESVRTLIWTVVVVFFLTYVFAVFGVVLISVKLQEVYEEHLRTGNDDNDIQALYDAFGGVFPMMYTLVQVLTYDSWNGIARPLMNYVPMSWLFFYLYMCFAVIVLMNLVTAIIVENALAHSKRDEDAQLRKMQQERQTELNKFRNLFEIMDVDGDGFLTWPEFEMAFEKPDVRLQLELLNFQPEDLQEVFTLLDTGDGLLSLSEFFEGITRMQGVASAKDTFRIWKTGEIMLRVLQQHSTEVQEDLSDIMNRLHTQPRIRDGTLRKRTSVAVHSARQVESKTPSTEFDSLDFRDMPSVSSHVSGGCAPPPPAVAPPLLDSKVSPLNSSRANTEALQVQERLITAVDTKVDECKSAVQDCSKKVDVIGVELTEMRTTMVNLVRCLQGGNSEKPPLRELPPCCGTGTSTPSHVRK